MNIAILGSGNIGETLGKKWAQAGHTIQFGVRDPQKAEVQSLVSALRSKASAADVARAIDFGEAVLFAIPGAAMEGTITANASALNGKLLIDAANKFGAPVMNSQAIFSARTPQANVYRAFNTYGWENFEAAEINGVPGDLFYCGPDGQPRAQMERLITDVGLRPLYVGGSDQVDTVDSILRLWFTLVSQRKMSRHTMFKVLTE